MDIVLGVVEITVATTIHKKHLGNWRGDRCDADQQLYNEQTVSITVVDIVHG